ncbi:MAG: DNA helicase RecQ [Taibaiella sp.]|nr:DNA helicase RecQ [Taibaiella sp.]
MIQYTTGQLAGALKHYFGYDDFRLEQEHIIRTVLAGRDVLAIMPTGGGKSICYQLPALLLDGLTIVVSPLIALMKDQVDALHAAGIEAAFINSSQTAAQQQTILQKIKNNSLKLLYAAPERLMNDQSFFSLLKEIKPVLFAIDEAHCISQWGHDFRQEYLQLATIKKNFPGTPVIALTASADGVTQNDIADKLALQNPKKYVSSFNRPNIYYYVRPKKNTTGHVIDYIKQHPDDCGIVYALSRKATEEIAAQIANNGIKTAYYHAGMSSEERSRVQEAFQRDEVRVIVATIAFGMGIDKSNVRYVIHYDVPKNIEGYYQETGRAGRDGLKSDAILFYSVADIIKLKNFVIVDGNQQQTAVAIKKLNLMQEFCESEGCRRQYLMQYFGEAAPAYCGSCDYCLSSLEQKDMTVDAQKLLSAIARTGERFGAGYVIDFLRGSESEKIYTAHKELKTYGIGKHLKKDEWNWLVKQMLRLKMLGRTEDTYSTLQLNDVSRDILQGRLQVQLVMKKEDKEKPEDAVTTYDAALMKELRSVRTALAEEENVPPYIIIADNALSEMASYLPQSYEELKGISGFGDYKISKYGAAFMKVLQQHARAGSLESKMHLKAPKKERKTTITKASGPTNTQHTSLQLYNEGLSVAEIAAQRNLSPITVEGHLAVFVITGELEITKLVSAEKLAYMQPFIKTAGSKGLLKPLKDLLGDDYTYGEIRLAMAYYNKQ